MSAAPVGPKWRRAAYMAHMRAAQALDDAERDLASARALLAGWESGGYVPAFHFVRHTMNAAGEALAQLERHAAVAESELARIRNSGTANGASDG